MRTEIGELAARFIDSVEDEYGDDATVSIGGILVAVEHGDGENITYHQTWGPDDAALHEAIGLLELALRARYDSLGSAEG